MSNVQRPISNVQVGREEIKKNGGEARPGRGEADRIGRDSPSRLRPGRGLVLLAGRGTLGTLLRYTRFPRPGWGRGEASPRCWQRGGQAGDWNQENKCFAIQRRPAEVFR